MAPMGPKLVEHPTKAPFGLLAHEKGAWLQPVSIAALCSSPPFCVLLFVLHFVVFFVVVLSVELVFSKFQNTFSVTFNQFNKTSKTIFKI